YTAITGNRALLTRGVNVNASTPADLDPRTALGLSQDRHYLFLMTIDGRQPGYSDGAVDLNTAEWMIRLGAYQPHADDGRATMIRQGLE
ncbi:MAG: phosphodiester glycosidase family protein, partial [Chloroflexi bacterium]|nr:phosphodiester glycosidase family protein [Chloroflexota bacterium]